jgi:hypothetical protein
MMYGDGLATLRDYLNQIVKTRAASGDRNVAIIDFGTQDPAKNGLGSDWHPSVKTHQAMAAKVSEAIKNDLRW